MGESAGIMSRLNHTHQFIGKKTRRIRWQKMNSASSTIPENMVTTSWDEAALNSTNDIVIWHLTADEMDEAKRRELHETNVMDDDCYSLTNIPEMDWQFVKSASLEVQEDIAEIQFLDEDHLLFATAGGEVSIAKWFRSERRIRIIHAQSEIFGEEEDCVGFSLFGNDVACLGSSGTLKLFNIFSGGTAGHSYNFHSSQDRNYNSSGVGPVMCIEHFGSNELVTGSATGQLKIWDLRKRSSALDNALFVPDSGAVTAVRSNPSQRHILAAGYQSGGLAIWDLRNTDQSLMSLSTDIHSGPIWEVQFHPISPSHLFSASNDGHLVHWNASGVRQVGDNFGISPWSLSSADLRNQVKVTYLIPGNKLPVNSLDVIGDSVLAGVDDESIWMVKNLPIH